jgi:hypothetical protein
LKLTVCSRAWLVATKVLRRARRRVEAWRTLRTRTQVWWHSLGLLRLLWRGCQSRAALSCTSSHNTAEEIAWPMANLGWLRWRGAVVLRTLAGTTARLDFAFELRNPVLVSGDS